MVASVDTHTCPLHQGSIVRDGAKHVIVEGFPVACVSHKCICFGGPLDSVATGSATVFIGGKPAARRGELTMHGGVITTGATSVEVGGPSTTVTLESPLGPLEVMPDGQPLSGNQVTKSEYLTLWQENKLPNQDWGGWDVFEWKAPSWLGGDENHLRDYKDRWIRDHATSIQVASRMNDIPPLLLAGTAWIEVGGDPTWIDSVIHDVRSGVEAANNALKWVDDHDEGIGEWVSDQASDAAGIVGDVAGWIGDHDGGIGEKISNGISDAGKWIDEHDRGVGEWAGENVAKRIGGLINKATRDPELTSAGDVSIQIRRVARLQQMDPSKLSYTDRLKILQFLKDDQNNLAVVASHLRELSQVDFAEQQYLDDEAIRIIGSRYNRGPDFTREAIERNTSYGDLILRQKQKLNRLLATPTVTTSLGSGPQPIARGLNRT